MSMCKQGGSTAKDHRNHNKYVFSSSSISTEKISRCRVNFLIMPRSPTKFPSLLKCTQVWHQVLKSQGNSSWNPPNLYLGHSCLIFLNALLLAERTLKKHSMSKCMHKIKEQHLLERMSTSQPQPYDHSPLTTSI